jgi:hypothetical protein
MNGELSSLNRPSNVKVPAFEGPPGTIGNLLRQPQKPGSASDGWISVR